MKKKPEFGLYGIFGCPLSHTLSPAMQEAAFRALGQRAFYLALELEPRYFRQVMRGIGRLQLDGFNVTVPYKETVVGYLDGLTPEARAIGAVNAVFRRGRRWIGANTDADGLLKALNREARFRPRGKKILILGAGGATRAAVYALAAGGAREIVIANRHPERARRIVRRFGPLFKTTLWRTCPLSESALADGLRDASLVINATSVGLKPGDASLLPGRLIPRPGPGKRILFLDLIYRPARTRFLENAGRRGHNTLNGLAMLLYQGAKAFELWTGRRAPVRRMRAALEKGLKQ